LLLWCLSYNLYGSIIIIILNNFLSDRVFSVPNLNYYHIIKYIIIPQIEVCYFIAGHPCSWSKRTILLLRLYKKKKKNPRHSGSWVSVRGWRPLLVFWGGHMTLGAWLICPSSHKLINHLGLCCIIFMVLKKLLRIFSMDLRTAIASTMNIEHSFDSL